MKKKSIKNNTIIQAKTVASKPRNISEPRSGNYTAEYRDNILEVWNSGIYSSVPECAKSYNIKENTLYNWIHKAKKPIETTKTPEYNALKKDYARLQMELEILKKAAIYFASHAK